MSLVYCCCLGVVWVYVVGCLVDVVFSFWVLREQKLSGEERKRDEGKRLKWSLLVIGNNAAF